MSVEEGVLNQKLKISFFYLENREFTPAITDKPPFEVAFFFILQSFLKSLLSHIGISERKHLKKLCFFKINIAFHIEFYKSCLLNKA